MNCVVNRRRGLKEKGSGKAAHGHPLQAREYTGGWLAGKSKCRAGSPRDVRGREGLDSGRDDPGLQVVGDLGHIFRFTEVSPIIFVRAKAEYPLALGRQTKIGGND